ncbi:MAG: alpha-2-macroglobulin [Prevotella sp.]|nr:alpha-2-macroglobulin [Prevotella sp.]
MKKILYILTIMLNIPLLMTAQTYASLWEEVIDAEENDLPKSEQAALRKIVAKAEAEGNYDWLLRAELQEARALCSVSPDSLESAVERLKKREQEAKDDVLRAVYDAVLAYVYKDNRSLDEDNYEAISKSYYDKALAHPDKLAATKASDFEHLVDKGYDSRIFGDDLLSVIAWEARRYDVMRDYYVKSDNRTAAMFSSLKCLQQERPQGREKLASSAYLQRLDSLISKYGDLEETGEVALERYNFMSRQTDANARQKMEYIDEALGRWGKWKRMEELRNQRAMLTAVCYTATAPDEVAIPGQKQTISLTNMRGISSLSMHVYRVKGKGNISLRLNDAEDYKKLKPLLTELPELARNTTYSGHPDYELFEDSIELPGLPVGVYVVEFESNPVTYKERHYYYVSDVRVLALPMPEQKLRLVAVSATTGQPLAGAKLEVTSDIGYYKDKKTFNLTTDAKGEAIYQQREKERYATIFATIDTDNACPPLTRGENYSYYAGSELTHNVHIYTDRRIYRPGQSVQVAAILYTTKKGFQNEVEADKSVDIALYDANNQKIAEETVTTDRYGTCTTRFTLPTKGLTGDFKVKINYYSQTIRVEEYKRPTFEVEIPRPAIDYKAGDVLRVRGTARSYAGVPVQGANVRYKVMRRLAFWWYSYSYYWEQGRLGVGHDDEVLAEAETTTETDGSFIVEMPLTVPETLYPMFYNFVVTADVTDQAGETHQGSVSLPLGNRNRGFSLDAPDEVRVDEQATFTPSLRNAAGLPVEGKVRYRFDNTGRWLNAKANEPVNIPAMKSGRHTIKAICDKDTVEASFLVFSLDDRRPAEQTDDWFYVSHSQFPADGSPVTLQVGSSARNLHMLYTIFSGKKIIESGTVERNGELLNRKFNYKDEYGNAILLAFAWMKDGKAHHHETTIRRPVPDRQLRMKWQTFRDRLTPGQQEEWTLTITDPDGNPADAQLMATLYDKSLDQLQPHWWGLSPYLNLSAPSTAWHAPSWGSLSFNGYISTGYFRQESLSFTHFDHSVYPSRWVYRRRRYYNEVGSAPMLMKGAVMEDRAMPEPVLEREMAIGSLNLDEKIEEEEAVEEPKVEVRENLNETAFFYPQLTTDSAGCVALRFTLPESLTTWRLLSVAHSRDMMYGSLGGEAIAKKDVMIQPNMPRFLRQGDKAVISARVINTSEKPFKGTARLQLLDPETERPVAESRQEVSLEQGTTTSVQFDVKQDLSKLDLSLLIARVTVSGEGASDGEQHYLPLLPNREHVTVTMPFTQHEPGTKLIDLTKMVPSDATQAKLTFEYTNNPVWLLIQALPTLGHPDDDCAICQSASVYSNTLGQYIVDQNPQAKHVFEQWMREAGTETSLNSALQKNEELKDLLLTETPWVIDANQEQEQKHRLADFFDQNLMSQRLEKSLDKVKELQQPDGSWSWWPGMRGSLYMTVSISQMFVRLNDMIGDGNDKYATKTKKMLDRSFKFMGNEVVEIVKEMKKWEKKGVKPTFPSHTTLEWLYICAVDGRKLPSKVQAANDYLKKLLKKEVKRQSIYDKAMTAIVLNNKTYIKSLKEYTVYREDMGRYYDTDRALYSWRDYRIPTQVAAIEAIKRLTPNDSLTIVEMQRWLLQQKRTQAWDTPLTSVDAVYAFLNDNTQSLAPQEKTVLSVDGEQLQTPPATAGLGYVKTAMPAEGKKEFTAEKTSKGTSWGAVYAQFFQPTVNIADQQSGISVTREILDVDKTGDTYRLKVGDRVRVRITIVADRDYDFVQVIDKRAACMEPVSQKSGYQRGYYITPRDCTTNFYFDQLSKGKHVIETEYYVDRIGQYETGTCAVSCAYSPEFRGLTKAMTINVSPK